MSRLFKININLPVYMIQNSDKYDEKFTIKLFNECFVTLPRTIALYISENINKTLIYDNNANEIALNFSFSNKESQMKVKQILESYKDPKELEIKEEYDYLDFYNFGVAIGNADFQAPYLESCKKHAMEEITIENVVNHILWLTTNEIIDDVELEKRFSFIAKNFSVISQREDFIKWADKEVNYNLVERILRNENFHVKCEDDLVNFIIKIKKFHLLEFAKVEVCSISVISELHNIWTSNKFEEPIIEFICKKSLSDGRLKMERSELERRYDPEFISYIENNVIYYVKEKVVTLERIISEEIGGLKARVDKKVDIVSGKQLSSVDFTNEDKNKLNGIESGAKKTIVEDSLWSYSSSNALSASKGRELSNKIDDLEREIRNLKSEYFSIKEYNFKIFDKIDDLNEITTFGNYAIPSWEKANTIKNKPEEIKNEAFRLVVGDFLGDIYQEIYTYDNGDRWYRRKDDGKWNEWHKH